MLLCTLAIMIIIVTVRSVLGEGAFNSVYLSKTKVCHCVLLPLVWGLSLCFVACSYLPLHSSTLRLACLQLKQVSIKPEPRSPSYVAGKNLPDNNYMYRKVFAVHVADFFR